MIIYWQSEWQLPSIRGQIGTWVLLNICSAWKTFPPHLANNVRHYHLNGSCHDKYRRLKRRWQKRYLGQPGPPSSAGIIAVSMNFEVAGTDSTLWQFNDGDFDYDDLFFWMMVVIFARLLLLEVETTSWSSLCLPLFGITSIFRRWQW